MQRRAAASLAAQALREFRDRASLSQAPAAFQSHFGRQSAQAAAAHSSRSSSTAPPDAAQTAGGAAAASATPSTDAESRQPEERMAVIFTCNKCDNRAMRSFSKQSYQSGVVIIQCPECKSRHLIADRLGWFGENSSIETMLKDKGQQVKWHERGGTLELSEADATAWAQAIAQAKAEKEAKDKAEQS